MHFKTKSVQVAQENLFKMLIKVLFVLFLSITLIQCSKLLRTPKVYNAVITTDENLTPSRVYPVLQPVIQPAIPVLSPFFQATFIDPYSQNDVSDSRREFKNERSAHRKSVESDVIEQLSSSQDRVDEQLISTAAAKNLENKPDGEKSPIPLNEFGFPPSLIPLQKYPLYPFYPFIYDSYGNFPTVQQYPVLAPNSYPQQERQLPPLEQPLFHVGARKFDQQPSRDEKSLPVNENSLPSIASNHAIKNNANKNSDIPDVAIPPIPFTFKQK